MLGASSLIALAAFMAGCALATFYLTTFHDVRKPEGGPNRRGYVALTFAFGSLATIAATAIAEIRSIRKETEDARAETRRLAEIIETVKEQTDRIRLSDLQIHVTSLVDGPPIPDEILQKLPASTHAYGELANGDDKIRFGFDLRRVETRHYRGGTRTNPENRVRYVSTNLTAYVPWKLPLLEELEGHTLSFRVPLADIEFVESLPESKSSFSLGKWEHYGSFFIRGNGYDGSFEIRPSTPRSRLDDKAVFTIDITNQ